MIVCFSDTNNVTRLDTDNNGPADNLCHHSAILHVIKHGNIIKEH